MTGRIPTLVTGGAGFVGRTLVDDLTADGESVHVVDNLVEGEHPREWLPDGYERVEDGGEWADWEAFAHPSRGTVRFRRGDVRTVLPSLADADVGDVYHLAAVIGGRTSIEGEPLRVATDLSIDAELCNWAVEASPDRLLYASSSAAYPTALQNGEDPVRLREDDVRFRGEIGAPDMTYGWAKLTGEYLARFAAREYGLHVACVRPFSGYGEAQSFDYPVPSIARRACRREDPLTVWGSGEQVRDFVHVDDAVTAMRRALDAIDDGSAVNIGTGRPTDFFEVARLFADVAGYEPEIRNLPDKPEGPSFRCADPTRMERVLEWSPTIDLREGFERVYDSVAERTDAAVRDGTVDGARNAEPEPEPVESAEGTH